MRTLLWVSNFKKTCLNRDCKDTAFSKAVSFFKKATRFSWICAYVGTFMYIWMLITI